MDELYGLRALIKSTQDHVEESRNSLSSAERSMESTMQAIRDSHALIDKSDSLISRMSGTDDCTEPRSFDD